VRKKNSGNSRQQAQPESIYLQKKWGKDWVSCAENLTRHGWRPDRRGVMGKTTFQPRTRKKKERKKTARGVFYGAKTNEDGGW